MFLGIYFILPNYLLPTILNGGLVLTAEMSGAQLVNLKNRATHINESLTNGHVNGARFCRYQLVPSLREVKPRRSFSEDGRTLGSNLPILQLAY